MSKLSIVRQALETNPEVIIVNAEEKNYLPNRKGAFCHTMDDWVAPRNGLYTADELQTFMEGLVPDLKPTQQDGFRQYDEDRDLDFGKLYFDEKVGEERMATKRILTLTDEELLNVAGFVNGEQAIYEAVAKEYIRRTWVRPFPSETFARDVLDGWLEHSVYCARPSDLKRYKPQQSLLQRIVGMK